MDDQLLKLGIPNYLDALLFCHLPSSKISYSESLEKFLQGRKRFIFEELLAHRIKINTESNSSLKQTGYKFNYEKSDIDKMIDKRIKYELSIIIQKGFAPYFLIVQDIIQQTQ